MFLSWAWEKLLGRLLAASEVDMHAMGSVGNKHIQAIYMGIYIYIYIDTSHLLVQLPLN